MLVPVFGQSKAESLSTIRSAVYDRNYPAAIVELEKLKTDDPASFAKNNFDYLLARSQEKSGDFAGAMANFHTVASRNSKLKEYALWHMSQIFRTTGNLALERIYLQEIISFFPNSLLVSAAMNRTARGRLESGDLETAIALLSSPSGGVYARKSQGSTVEPFVRENLALLGGAYLSKGNAVEAREIFERLINTSSNFAQPDDFALAAVRGLDLLDSVTSLADQAHIQRAGIYQFNRDFDNSRRHYAAVISDHPSSSALPDAIFQTGRAYSLQGNYSESVKWFERVLEQFPEHPVSKDALLNAASAYTRLSKHGETIARYKKFIADHPSDERLDRAYLNIVDVFRDMGETTEALKWAAKTRETFKGKLPEALALFAEVRIHIAGSKWENALAGLETLPGIPDLGGANAPGGTSLAEIAFLKGFALEQLRRYPEAIDVYLSIPDGRNEFYGALATERLTRLSNDEKGSPAAAKLADVTAGLKDGDPDVQRRNAQAALRLSVTVDERERLLRIIEKAYCNLPTYRKSPKFKSIGEFETRRITAGADHHKILAELLLFLGLYDEAAPEFEAGGSTVSPDRDYELAVLYNRGDGAYRAVSFIEPLLRNAPADYQIELLPPTVSELLYPAPFVDSLLKHAAPRNVDPRFLLAIMRQESRFRPDVKSYAAARGLMQFISTTSDRIAGELGRETFVQDDLYDPATSILFGSHYVAGLFKLFPNQHEAVAASYNGGEDNMKRWLARSKSNLPGRYVPEIAYSQSKDYVQRVMANYRVYQILYDENLKRK